MSSLEFFSDQAARQVLAAEQAVLQNVRERCQRAAAAWSVLAAREKRSDDAREKRRIETEERADGDMRRLGQPVALD